LQVRRLAPPFNSLRSSSSPPCGPLLPLVYNIFGHASGYCNHQRTAFVLPEAQRPAWSHCIYIYTYIYTYIYIYIYISGVLSNWTPGVFYTYFYNHARRLRLETLVYIEVFRTCNGYFKPLDPGGGYASETAVAAVSELQRPLRNCFGSKTVTNL
jgi:hypothetical protein